MPDCRSCLEPMDEDGNTLNDCPVFRAPGNECEDCGACYCDGSC